LHGIPALGHAVDAFAGSLGWVGAVVSSLAGAVAGLLAGGAVVLLLTGWKRLRGEGAAVAH
jgi:predicted DNA repair protein MutK